MTNHEEDWDQRIEEFVAYCAKYEPRFRDTILPASAEEIAHLEAVARHPFPLEYRAWLLKMGRTPYNALGEFLADTVYGIEAVEQYYMAPPIPIPADAVYVATLDHDASYFLPVTRPPNGLRPFLLITYGFDDQAGEWVASERGDFVSQSSLLAWLYYEAFRKIRLPTLPHSVNIRESSISRKPDEPHTARQRAHFREIASRLGFTELPYLTIGDPVCCDRQDAALLFISEEHARDSLDIQANDERELARLVEIFTDNLDFVVW